MTSKSTSMLSEDQIKNNLSYILIQNEQESHQDLDQSQDFLIQKDQSQLNDVKKSYLETNEDLDKSQGDQYVEIKDKKSLFQRIREYMRNIHDSEKQKSGLSLMAESFLFGTVSLLTLFLKLLNGFRIGDQEDILKQAYERVEKIKANSSQIFDNQKINTQFIIYGQARLQQNTSKFENKPYLMYNLKFLDNLQRQGCEFPQQKNQKIKEKAYGFFDSDLAQSIYSFQLAVTLQFFLEQNQLKNGENVFIFGTKIGNTSLLPLQVFKNFDFSKMQKSIFNLKIKDKFLGVLGITLFFICSYKFYVFLNKQISQVKEQVDKIVKDDDDNQHFEQQPNKINNNKKNKNKKNNFESKEDNNFKLNVQFNFSYLLFTEKFNIYQYFTQKVS